MKINELLKKNHGYVTTSELINIGITKPMIPSLIEKKIIRKVAQGIYIDYKTFEDEFYILQKRFSNIVFSYNTACYLWGLSDRAPYKIEVTTLSHNNINENIDIHYVNEEKFNIGITTKTSPCGNPISVYNEERCICDIIKNKNSVDAELYNKIIKNYFKRKNKDLERLEEYAKIFNVYEKVIDIMEVLM
ncbi:MAG: type IV toxin-antitoxin system AbiEi family antitoxin domain-containing protein [Clostridia bacterium]|nr:type IV toxin-antitoxin system AbiEi family antitoxin domain-containing protein [Clostridia bacterium]